MADIRFMRTGAGLLTALSLGLGLVAGGCSGSATDDDDSTTTGSSLILTVTPEWEGVINFDGVSENDTIALKQDGTYDVKFTVTSQTSGFKFAAPGSCNGSHECLHVHVLLDGTAGGDPYNAAGYTSPITADFSVLSDPTGKHNIKLQVVYDDHTPVASAGGETDVNVNVPSPTVKPTVVIVTPAPNQTITLDASKKVTVAMKVTGYTLMEPGDCGSTPNCGHIHINGSDADGNQCNADGAPYNNAGAGETDDKGVTTLDADLGLCAQSSGAKTITAQLVTDTHDPIQGPTAKATVDVNILSSTDPAITVTGPANGDTVTLGNDGYKAVPISFDVKNFTLKAPGDCGTTPNCGHVHLLIDGVNGNAPTAPYNNADAVSPIDANFYWLDVNGFASTGVHQITLGLYNDTHEPITVNGVEVTTKVTLTTQANSNPSITITTPKSGTTARLSNDGQDTVTVVYSVTNFTLMAPGDCGSTPNCGHIHLLIDDTHGNQSQSVPYNNASADPKTMLALFQYLTANGYDKLGDHTISLELHKDDHSPVTVDNKAGDPITIAAFTHVTVQAAQGGGGGGGTLK
jgi:hypothetical protein